MDIFSIIVIAIGLAMDAFAVSIASGVTIRCFKQRIAFRVAFFFGFFQAIMPVLGWLAGNSFRIYITSFDHWIAFGLLLFIGGKMIYESFYLEEKQKSCNPENILILFTLAIATSIDALAVGLSFSILNLNIIEPILIIGVITFVLSYIGVFIGDKFGSLFENKIEIIGGLVLIGIGIKILLEHLL
ncbi:MAG: hypothetical protein PWQ09_1737 [Candidatus Cloacimonadota bacterium]|jgi:putative Mn2+ efflux pump MntP|nr:hypothetical protein [Candidatus Cloacimonadota bacterium]